MEAIIRAEYNEMPGMRLTAAQAARLWSLAPEHCLAVLQGLVRAGFLAQDMMGRYGRRIDLRPPLSMEKRAVRAK